MPEPTTNPTPPPAQPPLLPNVERGGFVSYVDLDGTSEVVEIAGQPFVSVAAKWARFEPLPAHRRPVPLPGCCIELRPGDVLRVPVDCDGIRGHVMFCVDELGLPLVKLKRLEADPRKAEPIEAIGHVHQCMHAPAPAPGSKAPKPPENKEIR